MAYTLRLDRVPELPEVEALALDLKGRLDGRAIAKVHIAAFSALKTYDPPLTALEGSFVDDVTRHGKFLDIHASGLHLVFHLARAGWIRWRDEVPTIPPQAEQQVDARRARRPRRPVRPRRHRGGHQEVAGDVRRPRTRSDVPGIASLGPDPLTDEFTVDVLRGILEREGRKQIKGVLRHQGTIAGIGNAYSDELLHAARMSPFKPANSLDDAELATLYAAIRDVLGDAVDRSRGLAASELKGEKKSNLAVHGRTGEKCPVCGDVVREVSFADSSLQYCADLPDRRQAARRPPDEQAAQVGARGPDESPDRRHQRRARPAARGLTVLDVREPSSGRTATSRARCTSR